jgi:hypothetical protein
MTVSSAVCEKERRLEPMSIRPEQKEKGQVFISNLGAGEVADGARFKSFVMERCPRPTSKKTYLLAQNSLDTEPEANQFFRAISNQKNKNVWAHSGGNQENEAPSQLKTRKIKSSNRGNLFLQHGNLDFSLKSKDFSA